MMAKRYFYLLVEEGFRELSSRLRIGDAILAPNLEVWIGQQWWFAENFDRLHPGVVLFKGSNSIQKVNMRRAKLAGHLVASIEEEAFGLAVFDGENLFDFQVGRFCDLFCVQGESLARFLRCMGIASETSISVTGNPRADLLRPPHDDKIRVEAARIRERHGEFVLVNTNYASINPYDIDVYNYYRRCIDAGVYDPENPEDLAKFDKLIEWEHQNLKLIIQFIRRWPEYSTRRLVIRPHPSEASGTWHHNLGGLDHVKIVDGTDHLSWIAASRALVHTSSTTGLEAYLLGVPSANLSPGKDPFSRHFLANLVNCTFEDVEVALKYVAAGAEQRDTAAPSGKQHAFQAMLLHHLLVDENETAARRVAQSLVRLSERISRETDRSGSSSFVAIKNTTRQANKAGMDVATFTNLVRAVYSHAKEAEFPLIESVAPMVYRLRTESGGR